MLDASELAQLQADAAFVACDSPCTVQRKTRTVRASGGATTTKTVVSPNGLLVGMSQPTAGQLQNYGYLIGDLAAWQVKFPVSFVPLEQDELTVNGQVLTVQKVLNPRSYPALITVLATEVK